MATWLHGKHYGYKRTVEQTAYVCMIIQLHAIVNVHEVLQLHYYIYDVRMYK